MNEPKKRKAMFKFSVDFKLRFIVLSKHSVSTVNLNRAKRKTKCKKVAKKVAEE